MKKFICLLLILSMLLCLAGCGGSSYGVRTVQTLVEQEYSMAFRPGDTTYTYIAAMVQQLAYEGKVDELAVKWLGDRIIDFDKDPALLEQIGLPEPRTIIIGVDINSFPMAYVANGEYWGFDVELALAVCERLGWTPIFQEIEKENVYIELSSGNIDCAWGGLALNPDEVEKGKYAQFGPYVENDIVIASRNGSSVWNRLMLTGKNMTMCSTPEAMEALNTDEKLAKRLGQITRLAGGTTECFDYLYQGKCDAVLTDSTALHYYNCH